MYVVVNVRRNQRCVRDIEDVDVVVAGCTLATANDDGRPCALPSSQGARGGAGHLASRNRTLESSLGWRNGIKKKFCAMKD